jgi:Tissue inhibitor of metalloproteinase.
MKRVVSVVLLAVLVLTGLMAFPEREASACSCAASGPKEKLESYAAVFVGEVVDKGGTKRSQFGKLRKYTFEVKEAWKGVEKSPFSIYAYDGGEESCGYQFQVGQSYLVYSYQDKDGTLQTNLCSGNVLIDQADDDMKQLGMGTTIEANEGIGSKTKDRNLSLYYGLGAILLLVGAAYVWYWRRRKKNRF